MTTTRSLRRAAALALAPLLAAGIAGCDDMLTQPPRDIIVADNLYTNYAGFQAGINALYALVRQERYGYDGTANNIKNMAMMVGTDAVWANYEDNGTRPYNDWGEYNSSLEGDFNTIWSWLYRTVNAANVIINRAENPAVVWTPEQKATILGEAHLFRAWAYRHLTYLWGDVPLNLEEASGTNVRTDWERAPKEEVWAQMEQDLLLAEQLLPDAPADASRLSKAVARHYLAELYLRMGQPELAEAMALAVTESGDYALITERYGVRASEPGVPFMDQFYDGNTDRSQGNTEALWIFDYQQNVPGGGANIMRRYWVNRYYSIKGMHVAPEYGGRGIGRLAPTAWALALYEPGDDRGSQYALRLFYQYNDAASLPAGASLGDTVWTKVTGEKNSTPSWATTTKWDWVDPLDPEGSDQYNDQPYLRLAETYLLLAEAHFEQGELPEAAEAINVVRRRANATEIDAGDVTIDFILDERARELLSEEHRRYTLLRTGTWLERTRLHNPIAGPMVAERDTLFAIPQPVIDANLGRPFPQNPGF